MIKMTNEELFENKMFDELWTQNYALTCREINKRFAWMQSLGADKEYMLEACMIAFTKAMSKYDINSGYKFITFYAFVLDREFKYMARTLRNKTNTMYNSSYSLDYIYSSNTGDKDMCLIDVISNKTLFEDTLFKSALLNELISKIDELELKMLSLHVDGYNQTQIGKVVGLTQLQVSRKLISMQKRLRSEYGGAAC